ncbi:MAG: AIR synthase family protein [Promethearchaeota archaeon]
MRPGKVPPEVLKDIVFKKLGREDPDVILGPHLGEDASLIRVGEVIIAASTDPITGSVEDVGWLAVHVNANDIATFGIMPRWFLASIMLPDGFDEKELQKIVDQIHAAASSLGISVAGGHSEISKGFGRPIIAGFMMGVTSPGGYVTSSGAKPGDAIILTKTIGIEGTAILATEGSAYLNTHLSDDIICQGKSLRNQISVVKDGVTAFGTGHITAMHDPTEGGLSGGIHELCDASGVGFEIYSDALPIDDSTIAICEVLDINPLELISSGCMIITCESGYADVVLGALEEAAVSAHIIGSILEEPARRLLITISDGIQLPRPKTDALWDALNKISPS